MLNEHIIAEALTEQCGHKPSRFLGSGRMTGNPHLTRRWPFGRVTEGLPTIQPAKKVFVLRLNE
jgi:hypothetical protein